MWRPTSPLRVEEFDLNIGGVGNTELEINCDYLKARADMVGNLTLKGEAREADIRSSGVGSLQAFDLMVGRLTVKNSGVG